MKTSVASSFLGLDVSKASFHAALRFGPQSRVLQRAFANDAGGFAALEHWLRKHSVLLQELHACLESTSRYGEGLALSLHAYVGTVSIVNPRLVKRYGQALNLRAKTDPADARLLAQFCAERHPRPWIPLSPERSALQEMTRRLGQLRAQQIAESNRLEAVRNAAVRADVEAHMAQLQQRMDQLLALLLAHVRTHSNLHEEATLLQSVPGIGAKSAAALLGELPDDLGAHYSHARQLAAHSGLTPQHRQSGQQHAPTQLSRIGSSRLRAILYMPALVGARHCPAFAHFRAKLIARGKTPKQAICALMRKLIHIIFGILKHRKPFNPSLLATS
ncbi:MAG TPA: IS110 family transposase [Verrucomicrobiae bacterium]|nr:IS110 family transposase [Verrucomicrobiae bacterium]